MKDPNKKLNGSVDLLAEALRGVIGEAVETAVEKANAPVLDMLVESEKKIGELSDKIDATAKMTNERIDTTNANMQVQFAKVEERFAEMQKDMTGMQKNITGMQKDITEIRKELRK